MDDLALSCTECGQELEVEVFDHDVYGGVNFISMTYTPCEGPICEGTNQYG